MTEHEARQKLIDACLILDAEGQGDLTRGHVSVRVPGDSAHFYMKPHSMGFDEVTHENIVVCNLDGEKVSGGGRRHSEVFIHSEIFRARPDVHSVIHAHPVHAVAWSATGRPLQPISQPAITFASVPYFTGTVDLIRTQAMGAAVADALGPHKAVLMRNHGVALAGGSLEEAVILAIQLEEAARIQLLAQAAGGAGALFDAETVERLRHNITRPDQYVVNFDYLRRRVRRQCAGA